MEKEEILVKVCKFARNIKRIELERKIGMNQENLLSVIVPVYGTEKLLPRCLDSIIESSYKNIEIIVVDDKSPENFDETMEVYLQNNKRKIKVVHHEKNKGLYHARLTGIEHATGNYIAFVDSDDHVSCDFYRRLMQQAVESKSDIVVGQYVLEYPDGKCTYQNLAHTRILNIDCYRENIIKLLLEQYGMDFSLHISCNKVYSKKLWDKALPILKQQTQHLIMCEDVLFSCVIFSLAEHLTNIHGSDYYYYFKGDEASTSLKNAQYKKYSKSIEDIELVFSFLKKYLANIDLEKADYYVRKWHELIQSIWQENVKHSNLNSTEKKQLLSIFFEYDSLDSERDSNDKDYFYQMYTETKLCSEKLKKMILSTEIKVVSFDIFDTLIVRPFYEPTDLFSFLEKKVKSILNIADNINFKQVRIQAEQIARERASYTNREEISLLEIYVVLQELLGIDEDALEKIKQEEIQLELKYCYQRKFAKELYDLAVSAGKKVIITSDMYLPEEVIKGILNAQDYKNYNKLYLSSTLLMTKASGSLYNYIIKDLHVNANEILHIGDNKHSDIEMAKAKGYQAYELYKTIDVLRGYTPIYNGSIFNKIYAQPFADRSAYNFERFFGLKCMLGVIANELFDNPFIEINRESDFNIDTHFIGYFALGLQTFGVANWLVDECSYYKYTNMNFLARDGYLPMLAFKKINLIYRNNVNINYVHLTRHSIIPFQMRSEADLNSLISNLNIFSMSPRKIIGIFADFIDKEKLINARRIVEENNFVYDLNFSSVNQWYTFLKIFREYFYDQKAIDAYVESMKEPLGKLYNGKTASFDVGYSCRSESALTKCYGFDISPYYMHINNDLALSRAEENNIKIHKFIGYSPAVTGCLREILISAQEPSCKNINNKNGEIVYTYKDYSLPYQEKYAIENIQKSALKFVDDIVNKFGNDMRFLYYQNEDINLVYEYLNNNPKNADMLIFNSIWFEDDFCLDKRNRMCDLWRNQISTLQTLDNIDIHGTFASVQPVWKRVIFLLLLNRGFLKMKVKEKYRNRPLLLSIMGNTYKGVRWLYKRLKHD